MKKYFESLARRLLKTKFVDLKEEEKNVIEVIASQSSIAEDVNESFHEQLSFGQRVADRVSAFGGSWRFILLFIAIMIVWVMVNTFHLLEATRFDPYPFILLNLILSTLAALQAPIIMMSQNRQAAKDRMELSQNYKVTLKTELEIMLLHQKVDELTALIAKKEQENDKI
ncbi:DUF1003 domain-containing protein [Marinomonas agarivorans]|nr:DUF1003 domain-containing protein [Marinomonas agarivorans]